MTTDQEKSATPISDTLNVGNSMTSYTISRIKEIELANVQLREELKLAELRAKMVPRPYADAHLMQGEIDEYKKKLSAAIEQLAIAQAREVRRFPMQGGPSIPWALAEIIYAGYSVLYGKSQSLERLAERGGFSWCEVEVIYNDKDGRSKEAIDKASQTPVARTALDEEIRKALLKCADVMDEREDIARVVGICIRQYVNSLTPTSQQSTEPSK